MEGKRALSRPLHDIIPSKRRRVLDPCSTSQSTYGVPRSLNLGRKIFLSHSGADKDFVWFLYLELCRRYPGDRVVFFDIITLPKGEVVSMDNILEEARASELGVLVLTHNFFMRTPNPMRELEAFVANEVRLLPLFFKMSVDEFKKKSWRARWEKRWRKWSVVDEELIKKWRYALEVVNVFNGLEYCKVASNPPEYIGKVVKEVIRIIRPAIWYSEEGVCGKDRWCQIVNNIYNRCALEGSSNHHTQIASTSTNNGCGYKLDMVGIYGFAGSGKTTLCKCLLDFYFQEFGGHVYYIDLASTPFHQGSSPTYYSSPSSMRMQHLLSILLGYNNDGHFTHLSQVPKAIFFNNGSCIFGH